MSCNKHRPHLLVLPEDSADRQIANGFLLSSQLNHRVIQVLPIAGGWLKVVAEFKNVHIPEMQKYVERRLVLIIDFDDQEERLIQIRQDIPEALAERVFILGVLSEPEDLRASIRKSFEEIGKTLAQDCLEGTRTMWDHPLLKHNESELNRMAENVRPFLFDSIG